MSQLNIVQLIEQNPLVNLSKSYHGRLINKIKANFTNEEQQLFVSSFYCYLNYKRSTDFVIDLDNVWKWLEFSNKDKAKRLLEKAFVENTDYKCLLTPKGEQKPGRGGQNKETILLTIKAFKTFCLKACTKKADQIHEYYLKMEETLQEVINEESNELKLQLTNVIKMAQTDKERIREKTLLEQFSENDQCVYYGLIDNTNDKSEKLIKFGNSNSLRLRVASHKKTYSNFRLVNAFKVDNKLHKRTILINNKNYTEILCIDALTIDALDKIIQDIIVGIEYTVDNYNKLLKENGHLNAKVKELSEENEKLISIKNTVVNSETPQDEYQNLLHNFMTVNEENKRLKIENQRMMKTLKNTSEEITSDEYLTITKNIKRIAKAADGLYHIGNNTYVKCFGTREEVWNGLAYKTSGELLKGDLMINKKGKLVSKSKFLHETVTDRFAGVNGTE